MIGQFGNFALHGLWGEHVDQAKVKTWVDLSGLQRSKAAGRETEGRFEGGSRGVAVEEGRGNAVLVMREEAHFGEFDFSFLRAEEAGALCFDEAVEPAIGVVRFVGEDGRKRGFRPADGSSVQAEAGVQQHKEEANGGHKNAAEGAEPADQDERGDPAAERVEQNVDEVAAAERAGNGAGGDQVRTTTASGRRRRKRCRQ